MQSSCMRTKGHPLDAHMQITNTGFFACRYITLNPTKLSRREAQCSS